MERARKMVIVPAERYKTLTPNKETVLKNQVVRENQNEKLLEDPRENVELNSIQTVGDNFSRLDSEMYDILRSKKYNDDYEKSKNYLQVLRRYLLFKENERKDAFLTSNDFNQTPLEHLGNIDESILGNVENVNHSTAPVTDEDILKSVPNTYLKKAEEILSFWKKTGKISWDNKGVTNIEGVIIQDSDISELLNYVLRKRVTVKPPVGKNELIKFMHKLDTPQLLIGNEEIINELDKLQNLNDSSASNNSFETTPEAKKKKSWLSFS